MNRVLIVTPVDSSGGSGLTAAVEAIRALGADPYPVASAVTLQAVRNESVERIPVDKAKILEMIRLNEPYEAAFLAVAPVTAEELKEFSEKVVVDPVLYTSFGAPLRDKEEALKAIKGAYVITPNAKEALKLTDSKNIEEAIERLAEYSERVIVKNVSGKDLIRAPTGRIVELKPKTPAVGYHDLRGTGTLYASTIAAMIAKGENPIEAARLAKRLVEISSALSVYTGSPKADPQVYLRKYKIEAETKRELEEYVLKVSRLEKLPALMPEVGSNFAYALPRAADKEEVFGITGRMIRVKKPPRIAIGGEVKLGGSSHLARAIIAMMRHYPEVRACMNIRYDPRIIEALKGFRISFYDRSKEPEEIKKVEGRTTQRGIEQALKRAEEEYGTRPEIVYHRGDIGKEPMILVFGEGPREIYEKIKMILKILERYDRFLDRYYALLRAYTRVNAF